MSDRTNPNADIAIEQTWNKITSISKQVGLRDGISDGRDSNFQNSFDIGYAEGFQNGYLLGKSKGALLAHSRQNSKETVIHRLLENTKGGDCVICKDNTLLEGDIKNIVEQQNQNCSVNTATLKSLLEEVSPSEVT